MVSLRQSALHPHPWPLRIPESLRLQNPSKSINPHLVTQISERYIPLSLNTSTTSKCPTTLPVKKFPLHIHFCPKKPSWKEGLPSLPDPADAACGQSLGGDGGALLHEPPHREPQRVPQGVLVHQEVAPTLGAGMGAVPLVWSQPERTRNGRAQGNGTL